MIHRDGRSLAWVAVSPIDFCWWADGEEESVGKACGKCSTYQSFPCQGHPPHRQAENESVSQTPSTPTSHLCFYIVSWSGASPAQTTWGVKECCLPNSCHHAVSLSFSSLSFCVASLLENSHLETSLCTGTCYTHPESHSVARSKLDSVWCLSKRPH